MIGEEKKINSSIKFAVGQKHSIALVRNDSHM